MHSRSTQAWEMNDFASPYRVVLREALMETVYELAGCLSDKSPVALRMTKESNARVEGIPV